MTEDLREQPAYTIPEVAHYLQVPLTTLRYWVLGRPGTAHPIIVPPGGQTGRPKLLSFMNVVEAHVLDAIRREHRIPLQKIRKAVVFLEKTFDSRRPLADESFQTDGVDLFVEQLGVLVSAMREPGQTEMRDLIYTYLRRIDRGSDGLPILLYPFTRNRVSEDAPRLIVINPQVSYGQPTIAGTGISIETIAERYKAGESIRDLARDYGRRTPEIEEAIRCWLAA